jgi:hypothetical protein
VAGEDAEPVVDTGLDELPVSVSETDCLATLLPFAAVLFVASLLAEWLLPE